MQCQPILQAGFIAYAQGLEPVKPVIEVLNDQPPAVEFRVQRGVVIGLPVGGTPVARNVGFNAAPCTNLAQGIDIKGFVGIAKEAIQAQFGRFGQVAQLGKDPFQFKCVVLVAGLGRRYGQR